MSITVSAIPGTMCDERLWSLMPQSENDYFNIKHIAIEQATSREQMSQVIKSTDAKHLLGFSMGGYLAMEYAVNNPQQLDSLVIIAASAQGLNAKETAERKVIIDWLDKKHYAGMSKRRLGQFISENSMCNDVVVQTILAMDKSLGHQVLKTQMSETSQRDSLLSKLSSIQCPVLIIGSHQDTLVAIEQLEKIHNELTQSQLKIIDHAGHMLPLEAPDTFKTLLDNFYKEII